MKYILLFFVLISCSKPNIVVDKIEQQPIPIELLSFKEAEMILLINQHRVDMGLIPYKTSLSLYKIANSNCMRMSSENSCNHNGFNDRFLDSGAYFFGEASSYNYKSAQSNVQAYINSLAHRETIESDVYEYVAISDIDKYNSLMVAKY